MPRFLKNQGSCTLYRTVADRSRFDCFGKGRPGIVPRASIPFDGINTRDAYGRREVPKVSVVFKRLSTAHHKFRYRLGTIRRSRTDGLKPNGNLYYARESIVERLVGATAGLEAGEPLPGGVVATVEPPCVGVGLNNSSSPFRTRSIV